jgi:asparagine synthase (glutamine-hydrolysing)
LNPAIAAAIPAMTGALRHRGPDDEGFFRSPRGVLGHRRLAIIDRAGGAQPMSNEDGSWWIVFNGEIYNHGPLRDRLQSLGHRFVTRSDTETIIHAYEEFGPSCLELIAGMFAFALYSPVSGELFIARDRLGKKPLFYAMLGGALHFASEIKALMPSPAWRGDTDLEHLETYLSLGYFMAPGTIYRGVRKLEPGHWLRMRGGTVELRKYWDVERFDDFSGDEAEALRLLDEQIAARVTERLESEVPLGAFLSGGIDSGLVVSYMSGVRSSPVITTTIGFGEAGHNEIADAGLTAARYGTDHHPHVVELDPDGVFDEIVAAYDEPFADSSSVPTYFVAREARRHVTVALTGDGGDESFGGYDFRYIPHARESAIRSALPEAARRVVGRAASMWPRTPRLPRPLRLGGTLENIAADPADAYYSDLCFLKPRMTRRLLGRAPDGDLRASAAYEAVTGPYRRCGSTHPAQRAEYADLKTYLPDDVLVKVDRMSMRHALEVRSPLLDHRLVELAFQLPQRLKRADRTGKHLLKRLAERRLPPPLLQARKRGFTAPVASWIRDRYRDAYRDEVLSQTAAIAGLVDPVVVRQLFDEHAGGRADHSYALWALWVLERWCGAQTARRETQVVEVSA